MNEWLLVGAGAFLGFAALLAVLAGFGAARGCPFCQGYCGMTRPRRRDRRTGP